MFKTATKTQSRLRMTIDGPAGSGKTYTALRLAHGLARAGRIAVIDTERGSASKYVGEAPDGTPWAFDVAELTDFSPERYVEAIVDAGRAGYAVLVVDSLSHAWEGKGGALEMKDRAADSQRTRNDYTAWRTISPLHNRMVDALLQSTLHVITTMRSRMEFVQEEDEHGRKTVRRVGMSAIQRPGMEYEFDVVGDMDVMHVMRVSKSRCAAIADAVVEKPGPAFLRPLLDWLESGAPDPRIEQANRARALRATGLTPREVAEQVGATVAQVIEWTL